MMKTKNLFLLVSGSIAAIIILIGACRKERLPVDDFQNMDSFYSDNEEPEQEITVDSGAGPCFVTAMRGTRICVTRPMLQDAVGNDIPDYPFKLKVIELYSIKHMLLRKQPSVAGGNILETSVEIRVRPFKNNNEAFLKPGKKYVMITDTLPAIVSGMKSWYGFINGGNNDWTDSLATIVPGFVDTLSSVTISSADYTLTPAKTGYVSAAKLHQSTAQYTTITFTVAGTNTQNIQVYISFNNFKSVMKVTNLVSLPVPVGETVTLIAFAKKQTNDFVMHQQTFTVTPAMQIALNMQVVTEAALLAALAAL